MVFNGRNQICTGKKIRIKDSSYRFIQGSSFKQYNYCSSNKIAASAIETSATIVWIETLLEKLDPFLVTKDLFHLLGWTHLRVSAHHGWLKCIFFFFYGLCDPVSSLQDIPGRNNLPLLPCRLIGPVNRGVTAHVFILNRDVTES